MSRWSCPKCSQKVEETFDVCWACGTTRDGIEDSAFLSADEAGPIEDPPVDLDKEPDDSLEDFAGVPWPELVDCYEGENTIEAKFVADLLNEQGIPAIAATHNMNLAMGGFQPSMWGYGPKIRVRPDDLPRALAWLKTYDTKKKARRMVQE